MRYVSRLSGVSKALIVAYSLFTGACGYDFQSKIKAVSLESAKAEFDEQAWLAPKAGTSHARKFPVVRVNFARAAEPGGFELVALDPGDRLFLGAHLRGDVQAEPTTGWAQAMVVASLQDTFIDVKDVALPLAAVDFEAGREYVLAVRVVRGTGETAQEIVRIPRVSAFVLDQGSVVASVPLTATRRDPSKPIGLLQRQSSYGFQGACTFNRGSQAGADVLPGDVAYATLYGLRVSEVLDLSRYTKHESGEYRFMLYVDTTALPETTVDDGTGWGAIHLVCETSSGTKNGSPSRLASGVDYTAPSVTRELPLFGERATLEGTTGSARLEFSAPGATPGTVTFVGAPQSLLLQLKSGTEIEQPGTGLKAADLAPVNFFQAASSACAGGTADSWCLTVSVVPGRAPGLGSYSIRVPFYDEAGNETIVVVPMRYNAARLEVEELGEFRL